MKPLDLTKPVQTRDGRPARIICTDRKGTYSVVALVGENEANVYYTKDGLFEELKGQDVIDLINVPQKYSRWVNIYPTDPPMTHEDADMVAGPTRIACIQIEFTEGEGL